MSNRYCAPMPRRALRASVLASALALALAGQSALAVTLGHARFVSALGQPLGIEVAVTSLSEAEQSTLRIQPAPEAAWAQAGLTPPVPLDSLQVALVTRGARPVVQVRSSQAFDAGAADLLLDITTAAGRLRHQVSLLAQPDPRVRLAATAAAGSSAMSASGAAAHGGDGASAVQVRRGDTLMALAKRHAPAGVSVYQWMAAVFAANPTAFLDGNLNRLRAGVSLAVPDAATMSALSDRQARRLFVDHARRLAGHGQAALAGQVATAEGGAQASSGQLESAVATAAVTAPAPQDRLRLSSGAAASGPSSAVPGRAGVQAQGANPGQTTAASGQMAPQTQAGAGLAGDAALAASAGQAGGLKGIGSQGHQANGQRSAGPAPNAAAAGGGVAAGASAAIPVDVRADDAVALRRNVQEAQQRVSQLEDNVKNINQALRQQGEAAQRIVVEGAKELGQSLTEIATAVSEGIVTAEPGADGTVAGKAAAPGTPPSAAAAVSGAAAAPGATTPADAGSPSAAAPRAPAGAHAPSSASAAAVPPALQAADGKAGGSWFREHLLLLLTGLFALVVLVIAWLLRRANAADDAPSNATSPFSQAMVQEQLDRIDLDLDSRPVDDASRPPR